MHKKYIVKHKFKARTTECNGIKFTSKKEAKRYHQLLLLQDKGDIVFFLRQTPMHLPGNIKYICDFLIFWSDGNVTFEDVKGFKTDVYKLKKKLVEDNYPINLVET
jgi:hypothetical protein